MSYEQAAGIQKPQLRFKEKKNNNNLLGSAQRNFATIPEQIHLDAPS